MVCLPHERDSLRHNGIEISPHAVPGPDAVSADAPRRDRPSKRRASIEPHGDGAAGAAIVSSGYIAEQKGVRDDGTATSFSGRASHRGGC